LLGGVERVKARATVHLQFSSEKRLVALVNALTPEINRQISSRSEVMLKRDFQVLVLDVEARDTVALRATLNAYLRWINSTVNVLETIENVS
jgi:tRNA threonylcarbamoyladenosine modification (KEOPS) complex  Pcc1 subunit